MYKCSLLANSKYRQTFLKANFSMIQAVRRRLTNQSTVTHDVKLCTRNHVTFNYEPYCSVVLLVFVNWNLFNCL